MAFEIMFNMFAKHTTITYMTKRHPSRNSMTRPHGIIPRSGREPWSVFDNQLHERAPGVCYTLRNQPSPLPVDTQHGVDRLSPTRVDEGTNYDARRFNNLGDRSDTPAKARYTSLRVKRWIK